jgi:hypothetical protein
MRIEHASVLDQYPVTILTGRVPDQAMLIGIITILIEGACNVADSSSASDIVAILIGYLMRWKH